MSYNSTRIKLNYRFLLLGAIFNFTVRCNRPSLIENVIQRNPPFHRQIIKVIVTPFQSPKMPKPILSRIIC